MRGKGKYQKQLRYVFLGIGAIGTFIILLAMSFIMTSSIQNRYRDSIRQNLTISNSLAEASLSVISSAITNLVQNTNINAWSNAESRPSFYYNAMLAYKDISTLRTTLHAIPFYPAITRLDEEAFVISSLGSSSKKDYFAEETTLSRQQISHLFDYYRTNSGELILPVYSKTGSLEDLYYILKRPFDKTDLIYIIRIPESSIFGNGNDKNYMIFNGNSLIACSHNDENLKQSYDFIYENLGSTYEYLPVSVNTPIEINKKNIYISSPSNLPFKIAFIYQNTQDGFMKLLFFLLISSVLLGSMAYLLFTKISNWLYTPIRNVISDVIPVQGTGIIDEFQIIRQNSVTVKELTVKLQEVMNHNNSLQTLKFYRDLLFGLDVTNNLLYEDQSSFNASHCVALFEFQENDDSLLDSDLFFSKSALLGIAQQNENIHIVNINHTICALIIECAAEDESRQVLTELCSQISDNLEYHIALSDIRTGILSIHSSYQEALKILEYKYLYYSSKIITLQQISGLEPTNYYYPIVTENKLIQALAEGNPVAADIFDNLIRENFTRRDLSPETLRSFIYSLLSTVNRALQELKTSPEELLRHSISFEKYYVNWSQPNIISAIRKLLLEFITAVNSRNSNSDHLMLQKMKNYIYENYSSDIMLNDIADELDITPKYCSNLFKKLSNDTFKNFLNHYRIDQAKKILEEYTEIKITDLSQMVGFNSSNTFIRVFGKYTGMTPGTYAASIHMNR